MASARIKMGSVNFDNLLYVACWLHGQIAYLRHPKNKGLTTQGVRRPVITY